MTTAYSHPPVSYFTYADYRKANATAGIASLPEALWNALRERAKSNDL